MLTTPQLVCGLKNVFVTEVMIHPDGEYVMAITSNGKLYSWGCGPQDNNMYVIILYESITITLNDSDICICVVLDSIRGHNKTHN